MIRVAGVVVLFNPDKETISNIYSYLDQIEKLFIIDNSEVASGFIRSEFAKNPKIVYKLNLNNLGIAGALNSALDLAENDGFEYLLTMDQDSFAEQSIVSKLMECFHEREKTAVVSPVHYFPVGKNEISENQNCQNTMVVMTSGNIVKVKTLQNAGGYDEDLFIDYVDHELCLRLINLGYNVLVCTESKLKHNLGNVKERRFLGKKIYPTNHSYLRHYYQTRNRFYIYKKYKKIFPSYVKKDKINFLKNILKIILFEKQKIRKLIFIMKGFMDFRNNSFGEYKGYLKSVLFLFYYINQL